MQGKVNKGIWVASEQALGYLAPGAGYLKRYALEETLADGSKSAITTGYYNSLEVDQAGNAWFSLIGNGLYKMEKKKLVNVLPGTQPTGLFLKYSIPLPHRQTAKFGVPVSTNIQSLTHKASVFQLQPGAQQQQLILLQLYHTTNQWSCSVNNQRLSG